MNGRVRFGLALTVLLAILSATALGQAAAESVLLHGSTAAANVKAESHFGSALNRATKQLAGSVQQNTQPSVGKVSPGKVTLVPKSSATPAGPGPVIASIQGGTRCAPAKPAGATAGSSTAAETTPTNCTSQGTAKPATQNYKSVITLSLQK
jgi:hypothetical protein